MRIERMSERRVWWDKVVTTCQYGESGDKRN